MIRIGVCQKCGQIKVVRDHHIYGYKGKHKDEVVPYCQLCDQNAHADARREGRCLLSHEEVNQLSKNSYRRRYYRDIHFSETLIPYVAIRESLFYNTHSGNTTISSFFMAYHGKHIFYIDEKVDA